MKSRFLPWDKRTSTMLTFIFVTAKLNFLHSFTVDLTDTAAQMFIFLCVSAHDIIKIINFVKWFTYSVIRTYGMCKDTKIEESAYVLLHSSLFIDTGKMLTRQNEQHSNALLLWIGEVRFSSLICFSAHALLLFPKMGIDMENTNQQHFSSNKQNVSCFWDEQSSAKKTEWKCGCW